MREYEKDPMRLKHILESIDNLLESYSQIDFNIMSNKDIRYFGIVKLLEIIGEASYMLTNEFKDRHPETPWRQIIDMRHILVHGYYKMDKAYIQSTIEEDLKPLRSQIESYLKEYEY
ncbi:MAG: DUF86 domain-containing protein [Muribaculaceae bacterium]|nr:DUF86 domain-containing protein [Muribaculaceae bacterium]